MLEFQLDANRACVLSMRDKSAWYCWLDAGSLCRLVTVGYVLPVDKLYVAIGTAFVTPSALARKLLW